MRKRVAAYRNRIRGELRKAFEEDRPPGDVAGSFALGVFITSLPTLGTGLIVFVVLAAVVDRISKLALLASVVVLNPVVKWGVYAGSFWLGTLLLGPVEGVTLSEVSLSAGPEILSRLLLGNFIIAVVFTIVGYVAALRFVEELRRRDIEPKEVVPDAIVE